jgi:hypothetical protein
MSSNAKRPALRPCAKWKNRDQLSKMSVFEIRYTIPEQEWEKARRRRGLADAEPIFDSFYGNVLIYINGASFLGAPYNMSVADLACGFATILSEGFPLSTSRALFRQSDDGLELQLAAEDGQVTISEDGRTMSMMATAFLDGARSFVWRFTREARARIPNALAWKDLKVLAEFIRLSAITDA